MELIKKRKAEDENENENGDITAAIATAMLNPVDARKILQPLTRDNLIEILENAVVAHSDVLDAVRAVADRTIALRKLFIRGLSLTTTSETLRTVFSPFGPLEEAIVILEKSTGKSKGYGFITYKHVDSAVMALKEPSKLIDGRITVTHLADTGSNPSAQSTGPGGFKSDSDVSNRKIYLSGVPVELSAETLLNFFMTYGEIEEGPLGFDKVTGKCRGFAFFVFKTEEGAKAALVEPVKNIDGHQVNCKFAVDNKKFKGAHPNGGIQQQQPPQYPVQNPGPQYGGGAGYGGFPSGNPPHPSSNYGLNSSIPSSMGGHGYSAGGSYGGGYGGSSDYGAYNNAGSSLYRLPGPSSGGMPPPNHMQPSLPRGPPGGMYQQPPYY